MILALVTASLLATTPQREGSQPLHLMDPSTVTLDAMEAELSRSLHELKLKDHDAPYYVGYQVTDHDSRSVNARYGALFADEQHAERRIYADVRVGSYAFDNSGVDPMIDIDLSAPDPGYEVRRDAPLDGDPAALRNALWLLTDERYKRALSTYLKKRAKGVYSVEEAGEKPPSFSQEKPARYTEVAPQLTWDREKWSALARKLSLAFKAHPEIFDSDVKIDAEQATRYFVSSEGGRVATATTIYGVHLDAVTRAPDGQLLENTRDLYAPSAAGIADEAALLAVTDQLIGELLALRQAPVVDPYTGPALLAPEATGVLFHEAVGHRLEGDRQDDDSEGRTFKGQIGNAVLPRFLTVVDDPTLSRVGPTPLNGFYRYDEQGIAAVRVPLVERGVLENFLLSRHMVKGFVHSNGHGRAAVGRAPAARMANLIVSAEPSHQLSWAALKGRLIAEARRQGKPYGLIIKDMTGGNTNTSGSGYQAFKAQPRLVYRVDVKTGQELLVRGVEMVGTPLTVINKIDALGDTPGIFNGYCGAESGYVPVSTVAPAALISEVELQRTTKTNQRPPILASPWAH
jgi:TldD protein